MVCYSIGGRIATIYPPLFRAGSDRERARPQDLRFWRGI